jgi:hypothetical protein
MIIYIFIKEYIYTIKIIRIFTNQGRKIIYTFILYYFKIQLMISLKNPPLENFFISLTRSGQTQCAPRVTSAPPPPEGNGKTGGRPRRTRGKIGSAPPLREKLARSRLADRAKHSP